MDVPPEGPLDLRQDGRARGGGRPRDVLLAHLLEDGDELRSGEIPPQHHRLAGSSRVIEHLGDERIRHRNSSLGV
ncbi:hypothetical protein D3C83_153620 [compost metagenome]